MGQPSLKKFLEIRKCADAADFELARSVAKDYMGWLGMDLAFQNIDGEFRNFASMYGGAQGCYLLALTENRELVGGVGLRLFSQRICEMKRLYIYNQFEGKGVGRRLCLELIEEGKALGYRKMRLDTISRLESANRLYESLGFYDIPSYRENPDPTASFMEIDLTSVK